eukprot:scaffold34618_cov159-Amphora_coffeaeformis.AAC.11
MDWNTFASIREIQVLAGLSLHSNIVRLYDVIFSTQYEYCLIYDYANQGSLESYLDQLRRENASTDNQPLLPDEQIRSILSDALRGLEHIHANGFFHRDISPGNLLLSDGVCKVGDFTLARPLFHSTTDNNGATPLTTYISTRWYRAPELLLRTRFYGAPVDMYAMGCVAAEVYDSKARPLFAADTEADQLHQILCTLGTPTQDTWPEGVDLMSRLQIQHPPVDGCLEDCLPSYLNPTTLDWFRSLLTLRPDRRLTASQALAHSFLSSGQQGIHVLDTSVLSKPSNPSHQAEAKPITTPRRPNVVRNPYKKTQSR